MPKSTPSQVSQLNKMATVCLQCLHGSVFSFLQPWDRILLRRHGRNLMVQILLVISAKESLKDMLRFSVTWLYTRGTRITLVTSVVRSFPILSTWKDTRRRSIIQTLLGSMFVVMCAQFGFHRAWF